MSDLLGPTKHVTNTEDFRRKESLELANFYDDEWMPHITYYDDINDLRDLIDSTDLVNISNSMEKSNQKRREKIYSLWEDIINAG